MISSSILQNAYVDMYRQIRNYTWGFRTVENLAELEIAVYTSFPDISEVRTRFNALYLELQDRFEDDEELKSAVNAFKDLIDKDDTFYAKLNSVREVITE